MGHWRVPFGQKLAWGMGGFADFFMSNTIVHLAMPIYNIGLGVPAALVGMALGLPRIFDAITDPPMGNISDNTRTRWGRRRPYIFAGAVLSGVIYAAIWIPPTSLGGGGLFAYLLITSMGFFLAYTVFMVPHSALGFEMSPDPHERTRVMAFRTFFMAVASLLTPWLYKLSLWIGHMSGGNEVVGIRYVGILVGLVIIVFGIVPAIFCRESPRAQAQGRIRFGEAAWHTLASRSYLVVTATLLIVLMAFNVIGPFGLYISIYHVCGGDKDFAAALYGWATTGGAVAALVALWPITAVSSRVGKRASLIVGEVIVLIAFLISLWVYTPRSPYLLIVSGVLAGLGLQWVCLLTVSMVSDCCDEDEVKTGLRREGMYQAMFGFAVKAGIGGAGAISGFMLAISGFESNEVPSEEVLLRMRLLFAFAPAALLLLSIVLTSFYPLDDRAMSRIRAILDDRRRPDEPEAIPAPAGGVADL